MKTAMISGCSRASALVLGVGLLMPDWAVAQTPAPPASEQAAPDFTPVLEPHAIELLKATSARLAAAKSMSFTAVVSYEFPSKLGPAIVYTVRYDVTMQRPNKLKVITPGDGPASEFYYDGKAMMAYVPDQDLVAVAAAPATIEEALTAAYKTAAIYYPFSDLVVDDPYAAMTEGAFLAFDIGLSGVVGGTKTDMVAWANDDVFLQIWIGVDDKLPRKIRAVYSADPLRLRHDMELSNWQIDPVVTADAFTSQKAQAGKHMAFANPAAAPPPGVKPLFIKPAEAAPATSQPKP